MSPKFFLGAGTSHSAYQIPGLPDIVVVCKTTNPDQSAEVIESVEDLYPEYNFGQAIAQLGPDIRICKRQNGIVPMVTTNHIGKPVFLPEAPGTSEKFNTSRLPHTVHLETLDPEGVRAEFIERVNRMLDTLEGMPVEAYKRALQEMHVIIDKGQSIDPSKPNNILMDPENETFGWIDLIPLDVRERGFTPFYLSKMITHAAGYHSSVKNKYLSPEEQALLTERENEVYRGVIRKVIAAVEITPSPYWNHEHSNIDFEEFGFTPEEQAALSRRMEMITSQSKNETSPEAVL